MSQDSNARVRTFLLTIIALVLAWTQPGTAASQAAVESKFRVWVENDLWPEALSRGISAATFNAAFQGVSLNWNLPDLVLPGQEGQTPRKQHQSEFRSPAQYFAHIGAVVSGGRAQASRNAGTLAAVETRYGVPQGILLAIWGRESGFGSAKIPHDAFEVLATKAYMSTRKAMFRAELLAALEIVQKGHAAPRSMKTSWAGALGQPQFLPTSFLAHAADGDGDGKADIWNSASDTLASIANYLKNHGWASGRDWGFEVHVPDNVTCALEGPDRGKRISEWAALGVGRVNGKPFPDHEAQLQGYLMMPAGRHGPAFIVTPNFYVLKKYNESDVYALFVGHAADRIRYGDRNFNGRWGKADRLYRSDIAMLQRALEREGYDVGGADGLPGFKTRRSIGDWQARNGRVPTCFPDAELVKAVR